jgi:sodium/potassium-transporting ATPase subunit alpha
VIGNSSEAALLKMVELCLGDTLAYRDRHTKVAEIPFNTTNKFHVTIHQTEDSSGHFVVMKGAPERLLKRCATILVDQVELPITEEWKKKFEHACRDMAERGERILGFCDLELSPEVYPIGFEFNTEEVNFPLDNLRFLGMVSLVDPPRPGKIYFSLQGAGAETAILSTGIFTKEGGRG